MDAIRYLLDTMVAVSFTIEKVLWVIERYLQINLSKVQITPLYKGRKAEDDITTPEWRLSLAFKATCCLFSGLPIPLCKQPLPTACIKHESEA